MKNITKYTLAFLIFNFQFFITHAQVAINENNREPDASAILDVSSTDKGLLIPRLDSTARKNITSPAEGLLVYDESNRSFWYFREEWTELNQDVNIEFDGKAIIVKQPIFFENVEDAVSNVSPDEDEDRTLSGEAWQSFTPTIDGQLSRIRVILSEGDEPIFDGGYMRVYEGEGVAGNLLAEVAVAAETSGDPNISFDGESVTLQKDSIYTFSLQDTVNNRWRQFYTSGYAGGRSSIGATFDLFFSTFMNFDSTYVHEAITFDTTGATYSMNLNAVDTIFFSDGTYQIKALPDPNGISDQMLITDSNGHILWSNLVTNTDNQMIDTFQLDSTRLALSLENDNKAAQIVDLSTLQDNLGDHNATQNIATNGFYISNDGEEEGIFVDSIGRVGIGTSSPTDYLEIPMSATNSDPQKIISNLAEDEGESIETAWQSYTATIDGTLGTISIPSSGFASTFWTVTIHQGEGTEGMVLGSLSASTNYDFSPLNIEQVQNGIYTFAISISSGEFDPYSNSDYDGGISSFGSDRDIAFELFINPSLEGAFSVGENGVLINNYALPLADGASGQILSTDGSGTLAWIDDSKVFTSADGITSSANNNDDFIFGADSLNHGTGSEQKFFFDKDKGAFRAGLITNDNWNKDSLGFASFAVGDNTKANGSRSIALGDDAIASGNRAIAIGAGAIATGTVAVAIGSDSEASGSSSTALGDDNIASGTVSTAFGLGNTASGNVATAFGNNSTAPGTVAIAMGMHVNAASQSELAVGQYNTNYTPDGVISFDEEDRLFVIGNGTSENNRSDALRIYKNGNAELNGALTIDSSYTFPISDGTTGQFLQTDGSGNVSWADQQTFTDTDNQNLAFNTSNNTLSIDDGNAVNLASINTDHQTVDKFELSDNMLLISLEGDEEPDISVDLTPLIDDLVPVGTIQMWPTSTAPSGWLICNGGSFNASTYPELNGVLGGNTLPNFSGRFPLGVGNSGTTGSTSHSIKSTGGEEQHVLTINEMPSHSHSITFGERSKGGSGNNVTDLDSSGKTETTSSTGGNQAHNNMPPFYTINFIIKAE